MTSFLQIPKIIRMKKSHTGKDKKTRAGRKRSKNLKQNHKNKDLSNLINLCFSSVSSIRYPNLPLLLSIKSFQNTWFSSKIKESFKIVSNWTILYFSICNKSANYWKESGSFTRLRLWSLSRKYYLYQMCC